ncbi:hypothetical protein GGR52DRAFT_589824 [Hypoxylon sp. FL1284]|nr:hypothetical protein GGR52DRAFT_589824 [Hypoxylon sp. FL1284]
MANSELPFYADGQDSAYKRMAPPPQGAQGPREPSTTGDDQTVPGRVPLICYVCRGTSKFSDVSHLLTHICSKGHLSQLYQMEISALTNEDAATTVEKFKIWKDTYMIDELAEHPPLSYLALREADSNGDAEERAAEDEAELEGVVAVAVGVMTNPDHDEADRSFHAVHGYEAPGGPSWSGELNPLMRAGGALGAPHRASFEDTSNENGSKYELSSDKSSNVSEMPSEGGASASKTKNGPPPGARMFDAATEEQKRQRNQRKPPEVHLRLELNSTLVTTDEHVHDNNFVYLRTRDVFDDASIDESEDEEEEEEEEQQVNQKRKRRSQPRSTRASRGSVRRATRSRGGSSTSRTTRASSQTSSSVALLRGQSVSSGRSNTANHGPMHLLHNHGFQEDAVMFQESMEGQNELGWTSPSQSSATEPLESPYRQRFDLAQLMDNAQPSQTSQRPQNAEQYYNVLTHQALEPYRAFEPYQAAHHNQHYPNAQSHQVGQPSQTVHPYQSYLNARSYQGFQPYQTTPSYGAFQPDQTAQPSETIETNQAGQSPQTVGPYQASQPSGQPYEATQFHQEFQPSQAFETWQAALPYHAAHFHQAVEPSHAIETTNDQAVQSPQIVESDQAQEAQAAQWPQFSDSALDFSAGDIPANNVEQTMQETPPDSQDDSEYFSIMDETVHQILTSDDSQGRLPGLALRPGNPNLTYGSSRMGLRRHATPSRFPGKENDALTLKSTATSANPYLQSTESPQGESYNPLFVENQARDGLGFRSYSSYDQDVKPETAGFQPINSRGTAEFDSLQMSSHHNEEAELWDLPDGRGAQAPSHHGAPFHSTQANDEAFDF